MSCGPCLSACPAHCLGLSHCPLPAFLLPHLQAGVFPGLFTQVSSSKGKVPFPSLLLPPAGLV